MGRSAGGFIALLCAFIAGCGVIPNPFPGKVEMAGMRDYFPEPSVARVPAANAEDITYEYSRLSRNDFAFAVAAAERECRAAGKGAQIVSLVAKGEERGWASFVCR